MLAYLRLRFWRWATSAAQARMLAALQVYVRSALYRRRSDAFVREHEARREEAARKAAVGHSSSG